MTSVRTELFANLSTGHLTRETIAALDLGPDNAPEADGWVKSLSYMEREYGYFMHVRDAEDLPSDLPECLVKAFNVAREAGAVWILFDRDEDPIEALEWFED